jgi:hypothetical protein
MAGFETKITRARFVVGPFSSTEMAQLGDLMVGTVRDRIHSGLNVDDQPSRALAPGYAKRKLAQGLPAVRDWTFTGRTLRSMKTLTANENRATVGFADAITDARAHVNNQRERAFGLSPRDREVLVKAVRQLQQNVVSVKTEAA